jgi:hypothetical protein
MPDDSGGPFLGSPPYFTWLGRIRIEESGARSQWRLPWVGHLRNSIFHLVPMGRRGGSGLRGVGQEAGGASLGWAVLRN